MNDSTFGESRRPARPAVDSRPGLHYDRALRGDIAPPVRFKEAFSRMRQAAAVRMSWSFRPAACLIAACAGTAAAAEPAGAQAPPAAPEAAASAVAPPAESSRWNTLVGLQASVAPEYSGSSRTGVEPNLLWAVQYGRFRISSSRAGGLLGFGEQVRGSGATAEFDAGRNWRYGVGLRVDSGRDSEDSDDLRGLPDVKATLRGRVYLVREFGRRFSVGGFVTQDVLGRGGGATAGLDFNFRQPLAGDRTVLSSGFGFGFADARSMRNYYGVPAESVAETGLPAYTPGGGLRDLHAGVDLTTALSNRWIAYVSAGASWLQGDAARSPLVRERQGYSFGIGIGYRCCKAPR